METCGGRSVLRARAETDQYKDEAHRHEACEYRQPTAPRSHARPSRPLAKARGLPRQRCQIGYRDRITWTRFRSMVLAGQDGVGEAVPAEFRAKRPWV